LPPQLVATALWVESDRAAGSREQIDAALKFEQRLEAKPKAANLIATLGR
jgi:hypothetical protein